MLALSESSADRLAPKANGAAGAFVSLVDDSVGDIVVEADAGEDAGFEAPNVKVAPVPGAAVASAAGFVAAACVAAGFEDPKAKAGVAAVAAWDAALLLLALGAPKENAGLAAVDAVELPALAAGAAEPAPAPAPKLNGAADPLEPLSLADDAAGVGLEEAPN